MRVKHARDKDATQSRPYPRLGFTFSQNQSIRRYYALDAQSPHDGRPDWFGSGG